MSVIYINSYVFASPSSSGITVENVAQSSLSVANRTTHNYTYNFVSTSQDGTVGLVVLLLGDDGDEVVTEPNDVDFIGQSSHSDAGCIWAGWYEPTSGDISSGSKAFSFTTESSEVFQYVIIEVKGVDLSSPVSNWVYDGSNADRTSVGPLSLTASEDGSLLIAVAATDDTGSTVLSMTSTNGFTQVAEIEPVTALPGFLVATKTVDAGTHNSPVFGLNQNDELVVAGFTINPG
jgi:hypothetical protein